MPDVVGKHLHDIDVRIGIEHARTDSILDLIKYGTALVIDQVNSDKVRGQGLGKLAGDKPLLPCGGDQRGCPPREKFARKSLLSPAILSIPATISFPSIYIRRSLPHVSQGLCIRSFL